MKTDHTTKLCTCLAAGLMLAVSASTADAAQYTAFSLEVAQARVEKAGESWRVKEKDVLNLAGINKVEGFVYDAESKDLVLVGQREEGRAELTLDDLVVALRARFRYNAWPLVSIDPTPDTEKTQMQFVRFEGGIGETEFGKSLYDADYRLKELDFGVAQSGVPGLKSTYDRDIEETESASAGSSGSSEISSRLWFYPINPHVVVREGVCVVRGLKVGVFTEVMSAKIGGKVIEDVKTFKSSTTEAFAVDVSSRFDDLCKSQPSFNRLRGLQELVAVSKALEELEERPDLSWWLEKYPVGKADTAKQTKVLRRKYDGSRGSFELSGGVHLTALAMRLDAGDVKALRDAVLAVRPGPDTLSWGFVAAEWVIPLGPDKVKPEDVSLLSQQAVFLMRARRFEEAVTILNLILAVDSDNAAAYHLRGTAFFEKDDADTAVRDLTKSIGLRPCYSPYFNRALAYDRKGDYAAALADWGNALELNPQSADARIGRGITFGNMGDYNRAIAEFDQAIALDPKIAQAYSSRSGAYLKGKKDLARAMSDAEQAIRLDPANPDAYHNRGVCFGAKGDPRLAIADFDRALELRPDFALAYYARAMSRVLTGELNAAFADCDKALRLRPKWAEAYCVRGGAYAHSGDLDRAIADFDKALELNPKSLLALELRGAAHYARGDFDAAWADVDRHRAAGGTPDPRLIDALEKEKPRRN